MERFDLYDKDRMPLNQTMERGGQVPDGCYHIVVHVCIFNDNWQMLIQRRQPFKDGWSGMWDISCDGSAISGETSQEAAEREIREELGLNISMNKMRIRLLFFMKDQKGGLKWWE